MSQKFCVIFTVVFISSSICAFGQSEGSPGIGKFISRCKQSFSWTESMSLHVHMEARSNRSTPERDLLVRDYTFRRDGNRAEWIGEIVIYDPNGNVYDTYFRRQTATGDRFLEATNVVGEKLKHALIRLDYKERQEILLDDADTFGPLIGRTTGIHHKGVIGILSDAENLSMSDAPEEINGILCYKLKAETRYGEVTVWIAPDKGYNAVKWSINCTPEHYTNDKLTADINVGPLKIENRLEVFEIKELNDIGETLIPKTANYTLRVDFSDGSVFSTSHKYEVDDVQFNPDFESLGAFKVDLPDGTPVTIEEHPGIKYVWQNGKIVPAEEAGDREKCGRGKDSGDGQFLHLHQFVIYRRTGYFSRCIG